MAKKKASKGKSAKMPKKIGGTKVPKEVRSAGDMLASLVTSPMARELVADALIAVAGVLAGNKKTREAVAGAGAQAASGAKDLGQTATGAVAEVNSWQRPQEAQGHAGPAPRPLTILQRWSRSRLRGAVLAGRPPPDPRKHSPSRRKNVASRRVRC